MKKTGIVIKFALRKLKGDKLIGLSSLIDDNCLVGPNELIPGLLESHLINCMQNSKLNFSKTIDVYLHNIRMSSM